MTFAECATACIKALAPQWSGPSSTFDSIVDRALRDVWDHCGCRYRGEVKVDWSQVLPQ